MKHWIFLEIGVEDGAQRREVIRATYETAVAAGEQNVWFLDGETLLPKATIQWMGSTQTMPVFSVWWRRSSRGWRRC